MIEKNYIIEHASHNIFGKPLVTNVYRSILVEAIVDVALTDWLWCSSDYSSFDFQHPDGTRLEVKQSAIKQSWKTERPSQPSWDIKARTGVWEDGVKWIERPGRNADIYVFGLHPIFDETADHRDPNQWMFYAILASALPPTQRLTPKHAAVLADLLRLEELSARVEELRTTRATRGSP